MNQTNADVDRLTREKAIDRLVFLRRKLPSHGTHGEEMYNAFDYLEHYLQSLSQEAVRDEVLEGSPCGSAEKEISDLTDELVAGHEGEAWTHSETRLHDMALSLAIRLDSARTLLLAWLEGLYKLPNGEYLVNETRRQLGEPAIALKREPNAAAGASDE